MNPAKKRLHRFLKKITQIDFKDVLICVIGFLISVIIFSGCAVQKAPYQETRLLLGTYVTIKIEDADKSNFEKKEAANKAFDEIIRIENLLSSFKKDNIIDKINNSETKEQFLDEETFYILERAKYFNKISDGAFDVTVLPLLELWGFHKKNYTVPTSQVVAVVLEKIGSDEMILDSEKGSVKFLEPGMKIDLGGIGKGYAVDKATLVLRKNGIKNALVAAAGDIYCMGRRSERKKWSVGIRDPRYKNRIIEKVDLEDMAISTSGGYEQFFEAKGRRYIHIFDPRTGNPVENNLASVTIIAKDCLTTDALATAVVVLGKEKGLELIKGLENVEAIVITKEEGKIRINKER